MIKNFVWSGDSNVKKLCTVAWKYMCKDKEEGGLAVKDLALVNTAAKLHLYWKFLNSIVPGL